MKKKRNVGDEIIQGLQEGLEYAKSLGKPGRKKTGLKVHQVYIPTEVNVKDIREKVGLSQADFAKKFGFNVRTIQHWELGDRSPQGHTRIFLSLISKAPKTIEGLMTDIIDPGHGFAQA